VGGMRAMLGHWAGAGIRLPYAKAPSTVARCVILFGPESQWRSSGFLVLGVGRRNGRLHYWVCTPLRKIRAGFMEASIHRLPYWQVNIRAFGASSLKERSS
jgi:hypothetical protein